MTLKRFLSLALALVMIVGMFPVSVASAAETKTIYLNAGGSSLWDQGGAWFAAWVWPDGSDGAWYTFSDTDADGIYEIEVPGGSTGMKVNRMAKGTTEPSWTPGDSGYWNQTGDLDISTNNYCTITDWNSATMSEKTPSAPTYHVAGAEGLTGYNWATSENQMTDADGDGTYEKTFSDIAKGTYEYKIAVNGTWDVSWGANGGTENASVTVEDTYSKRNVTVKFTPSTKALSAEVVCAHGNTTESVTAATCGQDGKKVVTCTECTATVSSEVIDATGEHNYERGTCSVCGAADPEYVAPVAKIGDTEYTTFDAALTAANAMTGDVTVEIYDKVTLNTSLSGSYDSIKFVGKDTDAEIYLEVQGYITATGKKVAFEDLTLSKSEGGFITNAGFMNVAFGVYDVVEVTYTDCTFSNGAYASSGKVTFDKCTFYRSYDKYGLWAYGDVDCVVDGCTFADYRGIKMYAEGAAKTTNLTVKNSNFSAVTDKPAIVLTYGESVTLEGNTYSSTGVFELDLDGDPNGTPVTSDVAPTCVNDNGACGVLVDGKIYTTVAQAAAVATSGSTVTLLHDSTETVELPEGVTLDKNGYTAENVTVATPAAPTYVAKIGDNTYETFADAMTAANAMEGAVTVEIYGEVEFTDGMELKGSYDSISFVGKADDAKITINQTAGGDYLEAHGKTVAFTDLILAKANPAWSGNSAHMGNYFSIQGGTVTYTNCTFPNGACTSGGTATYNNCTFKNASEEYGLWVYDDALVTVNGGTIDSAKGIKVYSEDEASITSTLTVKNATFTENVTAKPAVAIGYAESVTLIGNTYNTTTGVLELDSGSDADCEGVTFVAQDAEGKDIASTLTAADRSNSSAPCGVLVVKTDGTTKIYTTVTNAADYVVSGDKVILLYDSTETVELPEGVELNKNGHTADGVTVAVSKAKVAYIGETGYETLQAAIDAATAEAGTYEIVLASGTIDEDVVIHQTEGVNITIKGDSTNTVFTGYIEVYGHARHDGAETLTFDGIVFKTSEASHVFIEQTCQTSTSESAAKCYPHNVTVQNCSFTATGEAENTAAGMKYRYGYNIVVKNTTSTGLHSLMQNYAGVGLTVENVTITGKNGIALGTSQNVTVKGAKINATGYGLRIDAQIETTTTIEGCEINAFIPVVVRKTDQPHTLVINGTNTMTQTNTDGYWCVIGNAEYEENGSLPAAERTADVEITINGTVNGEQNKKGIYQPITGLKGTGTEEDPYLIRNLEELLWFQAKVDEQASDGSTQFAGKYFKLTADIDLAGINWEPIGSMSGDHGSFKGVFDGDGHTISNLNVQTTGNGIGLFAYTAGSAEIKNLTLNNVTVKSTDNSNYVGGVVGNAYASTKITNVHVTGNVSISGRGYIGGIAGHGYVVMDNVSVKGEGTISSSFWCAGGILGYGGEGTTNIMNATVEGTGETGLTITSAAGGLGSIVGMAEDNGGTQPISGSNLSAKNVDIKTYTGDYGDNYANYALGYLYGGNPTSQLTGTLTVENVSIETSNGEEPEVNDAVASIGTAIYFDLQTAIEAVAEGETITVLRDVTITSKAYGDNALNHARAVGFTLDLNGKTVTSDVGNSVLRFNISGSGATSDVAVTIKNGKIVSGANTWCAVMAVGIDGAKAVMNLEDVTIENNKGGDFAVKAGGNGVVNAKNVTINASYGGGFYAIGGEIVLDNCTVNQKGLWTEPYLSMAIGVSNGGKMTVKSGTYTAVPAAAADGYDQGSSHGSWAAGVLNSGGTLIINGGTFENGNYGEDSLATAARGLILADNSAVIEINGGTFKALKGIVDIQNSLNDATKTPSGTIKGGSFSADPTNSYVTIAEGFEVKANEDGTYEVVEAEATYVARIGETYYATLAEALTAAQDGETVTLIWAEGDAAISMAGEVTGNKTVTITGTANVDWGQGFLFVGRGTNAGDGKLIFSNANLTSVSSATNRTYGINNSGAKINSTTTCNGTVEMINSNIELDYLINKGTLTVDGGSLTVYNGFSVGGRIASESATGSETTATMTIKNGATVEVKNHNGMGVGHEGYGVLNVEGSTFTYTGTNALVIAEEGTSFNVSGNSVLKLTSEDMEEVTIAEGHVACYNADVSAYIVGELPEAEVSDLTADGPITLTKDEYQVYNNSLVAATEDLTLPVVLQFEAKDTAEEAKANAFGGWNTDFYISMSGINENLDLTGCYLIGNYAPFGWIAIPLDGVEVENGVTYPVLGAMTKDWFTYEAICSDVKLFKCGIYLTDEVLAAHSGLEVNLELRIAPHTIYPETEDPSYIKIGETYSYDVDALKGEGLFDITSSNIVLGNELAMYFYVQNADLNGEDYVAVVTKSYADGREDVVVEIPYSEWESASNNRMRFKFDGIAAKEMSDNINAVINIASTGEAASNPYNDSIRGYVERGFANNMITDQELGTMLVDMLNYGAAAQEMFSYGLNDLANKNMTDYQETYATKEVTCENKQVKGTGYKSMSLTLESNILFNMFFYKENVTQDMTAVIKFTDHYGAAHEKKISGTDFVSATRGGEDVWMITLDELVVADARQIVTCTFLDAEGNAVEGVSGADSVESFCARAIAGNGGDYYEYIMKFCNAAYAYFH